MADPARPRTPGTRHCSTTTDGGPAGWALPCDTPNVVADLSVIDSDIAFDDPVGELGLDLSSIPDELICEGWAFYPGADGIAGVLVRLDVSGAIPVCP